MLRKGETMTEERRIKDRRDGTHFPPCPQLEEHLDLERAVLQELEEIKKTLKDMAELLTVFKNTKGFVTVIKWLGGIVIGAGALWLAIATIARGFKGP
jgi:hypothetical protein